MRRATSSPWSVTVLPVTEMPMPASTTTHYEAPSNPHRVRSKRRYAEDQPVPRCAVRALLQCVGFATVSSTMKLKAADGGAWPVNRYTLRDVRLCTGLSGPLAHW